jgi:hypothetical protein
MRRRSRGRGRSVDKGTCGPGIQPRKKLTPVRRRCRRKREAPSGAPISRGATESRAVADPMHVRKHLERQPGVPGSPRAAVALGRIGKSTSRIAEWGPIFVRVCPYFLFSTRICLNQHYWLAEMKRAGIRFTQSGNAFRRCSNPAALQPKKGIRLWIHL